MDAKELYEMKLHESITIGRADCGEVIAIRVPGGWIYVFPVSSTFVPLNSEFNRREVTA